MPSFVFISPQGISKANENIEMRSGYLMVFPLMHSVVHAGNGTSFTFCSFFQIQGFGSLEFSSFCLSP